MRLSQKFAVVLLVALLAARTGAFAEEAWVPSIASSSQWAVFPCTDYWITTSCGTDKDYSDPGSLPPTVSVGDTITYIDRNNKEKRFVVRHIKLFEFDKDVDFRYGGERLIAKKGETICTLYDAKSQSATRDTEYPSKIVIKNCRTLR
jgi:hypothetical protein